MSWQITASDDIDADGTGSATTGFVSASFPVNGILDDFNRANADPLDGSWTQGFQGTANGNLKIVSNKLTWSSGGSSGQGAATWNTSFNADQEVFVKIDTQQAGTIIDLYLRANNPGASNVTGYMIRYDQSFPRLASFRWDDDATVAQLTTDTLALSDGDLFGGYVQGTTGYIYHKPAAGSWTQINTFNASAYTSGGKIGISVYPSASTLVDDFGGGNF